MAMARVDHGDYFNECTPGYLNLEGRGDHVYNYYYGAGSVAYRRQLDRWYAERLEKDLSFAAAPA